MAHMDSSGDCMPVNERLARLYAAGVLRPPRSPPLTPDALIERLRSGPAIPDADLVGAILEGRASGA